MFKLNFKKDWQMHKSLLISFFLLSLIIFVVFAGFYLVIKFGDFPHRTTLILSSIWSILAILSSSLAIALPIFLMYLVLKNDLGKNKIQYSIYTPQPLILWYLPKVLYIFIIQGLFSLINLGYSYFSMDVAKNLSNITIDYDLMDHITSFLTSTFSFGFFALFTLCMAIYYSFRRKGVSWVLIVSVIVIYFLGHISYPIYQQIQLMINKVEIDTIYTILVPFIIKSTIGFIYIIISFYLFENKIEY